MNEKKNVAFFINSAYGGGAERVVSILSKQLEKEYNLYVFVIDDQKKFYKYGGSTVNVGGKSKHFEINLLHACFSINSVIRKYHIECVISFLDFPNLINTMFNRSCRKIISIRSQMDEMIYNTFREKAKLRLAKKYFVRADKVISVSNEMNQSMIRDFHIAKKKGCFIYNPYDILNIKQKASEKLPLDLDDFFKEHDTALAVGRIDGQKDYDLLIDVFAKVYDRHEKAGLIILGVGALEKQIRDKIQKLGLEHEVLLVGIQKNPFAFMKKCKLYVSASLYEGFPNSLVEAMACGLPCIHTDCKTGPREILAESSVPDITDVYYAEYGVLIPSYTRGIISRQQMMKIYTDAWIELLEHDELQCKYRNAAQRRAQDFSIEKCVQAYKSIIEE